MNKDKVFTAAIMLASTLAATSACSPSRQPNNQPALRSERAGPNDGGASLDFSLTNFTGTSLQGIYLSPTTSSGWEENVLGASKLKDGDTVEIRFNPKETTTIWDMRVEGVDGRYAEWKNLKLTELSEMTLVLKPTPQPVAIAEIE